LGIIKNYRLPLVIKNKIYVVYRTTHGFQKKSFDVKKREVNLNDNYNEDFPEISTDIIQKLNDKKKTGLVILHGEPGTGKTTTLVRTIAATLEFEKQVLVVAPSNAAVDLLVEKLGEMHISVVRMGHPARVTEDILNRTYDALFTKHRYYSEIKALKQRANQFFEMAKAYKHKEGRGDRYQRKLLRNEAHQYLDDASQLEFYISRDILQSHQVVACTPVTAAHSLLRSQRFSTLFIDEAAQALEPSCWIPLRLADKVVLAGDHCQLPPTIKSYKAAKAGLELTLFEKLMQREELGVMLNEQYRMNACIMGFSAKYFYKNELHAAQSVHAWQLTANEKPLEFMDTAGSGYEESMDTETLSKYNVAEAQMLLRRLEALIAGYGLAYVQEQGWTIGIISPYKAQVKLIRELSEESEAYPLLQALGRQWSINSVDGFQGQERDIIAISCVRSNQEGEIGFLAEERRMNVALTRARKKLIVIGDSATLASHPFYQAWLDYVQEKGEYRSVYEFL
jgi:superfamily I DNA and/or RNA helicase